jgi:hypothetical protein
MPSTPGFGFLRQAEGHRFGPDGIARVWAEPMNYKRYVIDGDDSGAPISSATARQTTARLLGIHINLPANVSSGLTAVLAAVIATSHAWHRNFLKVPVPLSREYTVPNFWQASISYC